MWYPDVELLMTFFALKDNRKLMKYVMHAKHRYLPNKKLIDGLDKDTFKEIIDTCNGFVK